MEKQSEVNRNCGIEMLKIISIFLIIISHVVMTIRLKNQFVSYDDYIFDFSYVSKGMSGIIWRYFSILVLWVIQYFLYVRHGFYLKKIPFQKISG